MFKPGDKVRCVKKSTWRFFGVEGNIYTVKRANECTIELMEDSNPEGDPIRRCDPRRFELVTAKLKRNLPAWF